MEKLKEIELGRGSQNSGQVEGWRDENLLGGGHSHADTGKLRFSQVGREVAAGRGGSGQCCSEECGMWPGATRVLGGHS